MKTNNLYTTLHGELVEPIFMNEFDKALRNFTKIIAPDEFDRLNFNLPRIMDNGSSYSISFAINTIESQKHARAALESMGRNAAHQLIRNLNPVCARCNFLTDFSAKSKKEEGLYGSEDLIAALTITCSKSVKASGTEKFRSTCPDERLAWKQGAPPSLPASRFIMPKPVRVLERMQKQELLDTFMNRSSDRTSFWHAENPLTKAVKIEKFSLGDIAQQVNLTDENFAAF